MVNMTCTSPPVCLRDVVPTKSLETYAIKSRAAPRGDKRCSGDASSDNDGAVPPNKVRKSQVVRERGDGAVSDGAECVGKGPENVYATQSTVELDKIPLNELDDLRGSEEDTGQCRTSWQHVAETSEEVDVVCGDATSRDIAVF
ncbi:hypothetical protein MRX96_055402 [Rhipicephalus microplus]